MSDEFFTIIVVNAILCLFLGAVIGGRRDSAGTGAILGLLFEELGLIVAFALDGRPKCAHCREPINQNAKLCPHCRSQLFWSGGEQHESIQSIQRAMVTRDALNARERESERIYLEQCRQRGAWWNAQWKKLVVVFAAVSKYLVAISQRAVERVKSLRRKTTTPKTGATDQSTNHSQTGTTAFYSDLNSWLFLQCLWAILLVGTMSIAAAYFTFRTLSKAALTERTPPAVATKPAGATNHNMSRTTPGTLPPKTELEVNQPATLANVQPEVALPGHRRDGEITAPHGEGQESLEQQLLVVDAPVKMRSVTDGSSLLNPAGGDDQSWTVLFPPKVKQNAPFPNHGNLAFQDFKDAKQKSFLVNGRFAMIGNQYELATGEQAANILLSGVKDFDMEARIDLGDLGGMFLLVGWKNGSGTMIRYITNRKSAGWITNHLNKYKCLNETDIHRGGNRLLGPQQVFMKVVNSKLSLTVGPAKMVVDYPLAHGEGGDVILGIFATQYGPKRVAVQSLRWR